MNLVVVIGRLGADPEMRFTPNGHPVTTFSVAVNRTYRNGDGEKERQTEWVRVVAWRRLAEICNQYLSKGRLVAVVGRLQSRSFEGNDGQMRYRTEVVARAVRILDRKPSEPVEPEPEEEEDIELDE